jgi:DNA-binding NarL/FixJ family response regulator
MVAVAAKLLAPERSEGVGVMTDFNGHPVVGPGGLRQAATDRDASEASIVVIDSHPIVAVGLQGVFAGSKGLKVCGTSTKPSEVALLIESVRPDLLIMGIDYEQISGLSLIKDLHIQYPALKILVLSAMDGTSPAEYCLRAGAKGFICKSCPVEEIAVAAREVLAGRLYLRQDQYSELLSKVVSEGGQPQQSPVERLTDSEFEVFCLIGHGKSNRDIAATLHRSVKTVETYRSRMKDKLGVANSVQLAQFAFQFLEAHPEHPAVH